MMEDVKVVSNFPHSLLPTRLPHRNPCCRAGCFDRPNTLHTRTTVRNVQVELAWLHLYRMFSSVTSFAFKNPISCFDTEIPRLPTLGGQSPESPELYLKLGGGTKGSLVKLLNPRSFSIDRHSGPTFRRLSSLRIFLGGELDKGHTLHIIGDGISLSAKV